MLKKLTVLSLMLTLVIFTSCKEDNPYEEYEGNWSGTYTGEDTGVWSVNINTEGAISGSFESDSIQDFPINLTGNVSESGSFNASRIIAGVTIEFIGQLTGSKGNGTWNNQQQEISGTWSGSKK